jgi:hypothetical protein
MHDEIIRLFTDLHPAQAHVWCSALEEEGIPAKVVGDYLDAGFGDIQGVRAELWVPAADAQRAQAIIDAHTPTATAAEEEA